MTPEFALTFLGTGTSVGVPVIGCACEVCTSTDPRNSRTRSSVHVKCGEVNLLVDSGPDLRQQALREKMTCLDAVLYTHGHVDHVVGFDELRAFCWARETPLPMYGHAEVLSTLRTMFSWAFSPDNTYRGYVKPEPREINGSIEFGKLSVTPLPVLHASVETCGYLFEHPGHPVIAYIPDAKEIPPSTLDIIREVDVLILDALRHSPHPTHLSVNESLAIIEECRAHRAWLTHVSHEVDHSSLEEILPPNVRVAYDGLRIPS